MKEKYFVYAECDKTEYHIPEYYLDIIECDEFELIQRSKYYINKWGTYGKKSIIGFFKGSSDEFFHIYNHETMLHPLLFNSVRLTEKGERVFESEFIRAVRDDDENLLYYAINF